MRRNFLLAAAVITVSALTAGCFGGDDRKTIAEIVADDPNFQTLEEALDAANLTSAFEGPTKQTVFAPTNAAFAALLTELGITKEALFADTDLLTAVLTYHVLGAEVPAADVAGLLGTAIEPIGGGFFKISDVEGALVIQDGRNRNSTITDTDVFAANGVIHVIDTVLLPANQDIVATAQSLPDFSILVEALVAADLVTTLQGPGPFTVFAPTNAAFAALLTELGLTKEELFADTALLTSVLTYHVVPNRVLAAEVPVDTPIATVQTGTFTVNGSFVITDGSGRTSNITGTDVFTSNGVIHVIDTVLLPAL